MKYCTLNEYAELLTQKTGLSTEVIDILEMALRGKVNLYYQTDKKNPAVQIEKIEAAGTGFNANYGSHYHYVSVSREKYSNKEFEYLHPEIKTKGDIIQIPDYELLVLKQQKKKVGADDKKRLKALDDFISIIEKAATAKNIPFDRTDMPLNKEMIYDELQKRNPALFKITLSSFRDNFWKKYVVPLNLYGVTNHPDKEFIKKVLG